EPEGSPRRIDPDTVFDLSIPGLLFGLLGARILFVILDWGNYAKHPVDALKIWTGGLSLHGGLLFGILYLIWFCRRRKVSIYALGDIGSVSWALAYAFGRVGCLLNGCCYGAVCDLPWGIRFPDEKNPGFLTPPSHPTQIYAILFNLAFYGIMVLWEKRPRRDGEIFYGYIGMYGFYRFVVDIWRVGGTSDRIVPNIPLSLTQAVSILMIAVSIAGIAWLRRHGPAVQDAAYASPGKAVTA
ncbi:MAG TPA: prolipoprotein diacylglyceryl transferase, partial [Chthonomonadaceae bacterium]|nr:prolipoprotein diacylglyceryl transferase [Chthonomonadaceae bacterium]